MPKKSVLIAIFLLILLYPQCSVKKTLRFEPETEGMSSMRLQRLDGIIEAAIEKHDFPGAVILVGRRGRVVFQRAYGESQWVPEHHRMEKDMIFDLASLTKPVATTTSIMLLLEQGKLRLQDKVKEYVPEFETYSDENDKPGEDACILHLLTHTSGLPPYTEDSEIKEKFGDSCKAEDLVNHIARLKKTNPPGNEFNYSCLGFITLAYIIKELTGQSVSEFAEENIFQPLGMKDTFFNPPEEYIDRCVPTEVINGIPLKGVVHDPLARLQGGVSGNAGLFSTVGDLAIFARMLLNRGRYKSTRVLSPLAVERMTELCREVSFSGRGLGWDLDSPYSSNGGDLFGPDSFGHTGYTSTSLWIDPKTKTFVIFLTNRIHPEDKGAVIAIRSKVANIVAASIINK